MQLKIILLTTLLVVIIVGFLTFGYLTYTLYHDTKNVTGETMVTGHKMFFYVQLVTHLLQFALGGLLMYKG